MTRKARQEHGLSSHPLYVKWQDMVRRCYHPKHRTYPWYGAKGVTVCDEWRENPAAFIRWAENAGWKPGLEIDKDIKIPGSKVYSPDTCSFVTHRENMLAVVGRESGRRTCKLKLSIKDVGDIIKRKQNGETTRQLAAEYGVDICTINRVYRKGV